MTGAVVGVVAGAAPAAAAGVATGADTAAETGVAVVPDAGPAPVDALTGTEGDGVGEGAGVGVAGLALLNVAKSIESFAFAAGFGAAAAFVGVGAVGAFAAGLFAFLAAGAGVGAATGVPNPGMTAENWLSKPVGSCAVSVLKIAWNWRLSSIGNWNRRFVRTRGPCSVLQFGSNLSIPPHSTRARQIISSGRSLHSTYSKV